ncbi:sulfatase-like hydrolase/transferase [Mucisphaera sp.]|uniref:sulfatase-like hydrolase/transferase n=1 Tax=Mucisphaera sp. TaxID=2913024 RepID=UPI003D0D847F
MSTADRKPVNILMIHSDQHRYDCLGYHGHRQLQTPRLDRLAAEGVDFSHAFTPTPICSPARASLVTGQWPSQHRCINIPPFEGYTPLRAEGPLLWELLHQAGYKQAHIGKFHKETAEEPPAYGVDIYVPEEEGYDAWRQEQGLPERVRTNGWFGEIDPGITAEQSRVAWGARETISAMERFAASGQPFMVRWDPSEPHLPNMIAPELADLYPPETIEPWPSFPDPLEDKPAIQAQQRRTWGTADWSWKQWSPVVSRYLAEITHLDEHIGRVLDRLEALGLAENTLVIYSTDHGDLCGAHGMMDKHFMMYDDVLRVPLTLRWPGVLPAGEVCDAFVTHELDLAATICEAAGIEQPAWFEGRSLIDVVTGNDPQPRDSSFSMYHGCQLGLFTSRSVRDRRWKYVWNLTTEDELYDLDTDPAELVNRIGDPACSDERNRLRLRMIGWCESIGDLILNEFTRPQLETPGVKP